MGCGRSLKTRVGCGRALLRYVPPERVRGAATSALMRRRSSFLTRKPSASSTSLRTVRPRRDGHPARPQVVSVYIDCFNRGAGSYFPGAIVRLSSPRPPMEQPPVYSRDRPVITAWSGRRARGGTSLHEHRLLFSWRRRSVLRARARPTRTPQLAARPLAAWGVRSGVVAAPSSEETLRAHHHRVLNPKCASNGRASGI